MSIAVMKPGVPSEPCVLVTERPSCTWVSMANTVLGAVAGATAAASYATVRPDAESDGCVPSAMSDQGVWAPWQSRVVCESCQATASVRMTGAARAAAGAWGSSGGTVVVQATRLPSAEITGSAV